MKYFREETLAVDSKARSGRLESNHARFLLQSLCCAHQGLDPGDEDSKHIFQAVPLEEVEEVNRQG